MRGLEARSIVAGYTRDTPVLHDVDFAVRPGERVAVIGRSGSGKSTLLKVLLRQVAQQSGTVTLNGVTVPTGSVRSMRPYRRLVQYIPQDPASSLDPHLPVRRLIGDPIRQLKEPGNHRKLVESALESVHLGPEFLSRRRHEISGGQAQRVAIARALATGSRFLLADEPVSGLDLPLRNEVLNTLSGLDGVAIVFVTHDLDAAVALCDRGVVLHRGRVVEEGPMRGLLNAPSHEETAALVQALPRLPL
ncbi:ABC transporter ATP-binding protein [Corynebacterium pilosum]|uniref:ABC-type transporter, duplicated ATPase component n=1 Tax=Corynebacterium pilosum TaxID=35756 RepID=A0A376CNE8_9CORY|nr:ABC transporter ATP-binding protein [Corynebacterium pilosum]STC70021.1 ABC-type transporter, duplicated ATPase component [Corynebacterium pilosum]